MENKFVWSTTVIIAISAGGAGFLTTIALVVFLTIRFRKKRRPGRFQAARVRRLSRYPGGNLSLTGSEVDGLPSFRSVRHGRFSRGPYGILGWSRTGESQDTLARRSCQSNASRATTTATISRVDLHNTPSTISWPMQPPAAQTRGYTGASSKALPLSPIHERHYGSVTDTPLQKVASQNSAASGTMGDRHDLKTSSNTHGSVLIAENALHAHRKSISDGFLGPAKRADDEAPRSATIGSNQLPATSQRPTRRRTLSLHCQDSGHVPMHRPISPPPDIPRYSRVQTLRYHPGNDEFRTSIRSIESTSSSLYEDDIVDDSQYEEDVVRSFPTPAKSSSKDMAYGLCENPIVMDSGNILKSKLPPTEARDCTNTSTSANFQSQPRSNQFLRSNAHHRRVHRSPSSGLTPSLVDQHGPSRNASNASYFEMTNKSISRSTEPSSPQSSRSGNGDNQDPPPQRHDDMSVRGLGESVPMHEATSVLQDISGNRGFHPADHAAQSAPAPTDEPFKWDTERNIEPGKPSALKDRSEGHKRQSCQRISFQPPPSPGPSTLAAMPEERGEGIVATLSRSSPPGFSITAPEYTISAPRPPSVAVFEPQLEHHHIPQRREQKAGGDYSATMSVYNWYNSSEELEGTPTRKSSAERTQYRQSRSLHSRPDSDSSWPLRGSSQLDTELPPSDNSTIISRGDTLQIPQFNSETFASFAPRFPEPQRKPPEWLLPTSRTIRGPRAAPPRRTSTGRSPNRHSPLRHTVKPSSGSKGPPDVKSNIKELRRQNSEISDTDATLFKQFLNLGDTTPLPGTPEIEDDVFEIVNPDLEHVSKGPTGLGIEGWSAKAEWLDVPNSQKSRVRT